jgi:hypothetical protein
MNTITRMLGIAAVLSTSIASAEDLPKKQTSVADSLAGNVLGSATTQVDRHVRSDATSRIARIKQELEKRKIIKAQKRSKKMDWAVETDAKYHRVTLKRVLASGETAPTAGERLAQLQQNTIQPTDAALVQVAQQVTQVVADIGGDPTDETLVPVRTGGTALGFTDGKKQTSMVTGHSVVLQRYIGNTPVVGPGGTLFVWLDEQGEIESISLPTDAYQQVKSSAALPSGKAPLQAAFSKQGLDRVPSKLGETLKLNGQSVTLKTMECGYIDDVDSTTLVRGCLVDVTDTRSAHELFVPAE